MYKCNLCGAIFETPKNYCEDLTPGGSFEGGSFNYRFCGCPECSCNDYDELIEMGEEDEI